jgi:hypothetical protein
MRFSGLIGYTEYPRAPNGRLPASLAPTGFPGAFDRGGPKRNDAVEIRADDARQHARHRRAVARRHWNRWSDGCEGNEAQMTDAA